MCLEWFCFPKIKVFIDDNVVVVEGVWHPINTLIMFVSVYAPQSIRDKRNLWLKLILMIKKWNKIVVLMRDFNEVCEVADRFGSVFN